MESNSALKAKMLALAIAMGASGPATPVRADELQDLKTQIEALQKKVGELEMNQEAAEKKQAAAIPDNVVTAGATKGSIKLPGSNTSVIRRIGFDRRGSVVRVAGESRIGSDGSWRNELPRRRRSLS